MKEKLVEAEQKAKIAKNEVRNTRQSKIENPQGKGEKYNRNRKKLNL
jgi:hypothetical protein